MQTRLIYSLPWHSLTHCCIRSHFFQNILPEDWKEMVGREREEGGCEWGHKTSYKTFSIYIIESSDLLYKYIELNFTIYPSIRANVCFWHTLLGKLKIIHQRFCIFIFHQEIQFDVSLTSVSWGDRFDYILRRYTRLLYILIGLK